MTNSKNRLVIKVSKQVHNSIPTMASFFADLHKLVSSKSNLSTNDKTLSFEVSLSENYLHYHLYASPHLTPIITPLLYTKYPALEITSTPPTKTQGEHSLTTSYTLKRFKYFPLKTTFTPSSDPYVILGTIAEKLKHLEETITLQLVISPTSESWLKQFLREKFFFIFGTFNDIKRFFAEPFLAKTSIDYFNEVNKKFAGKLFQASIRVHLTANSPSALQDNLALLNKAIAKLDNGDVNSLKQLAPSSLASDHFDRRIHSPHPFILSSDETAAFFHFPDQELNLSSVERSTVNQIEPPIDLPKAKFLGKDSVSVIGTTDYHNSKITFGLSRNDRNRHLYIVGKTGMGKSKLIELLTISDLHHNKGFCLIDPHGDLAQDVLTHIPKNRIKDVIYFNPADSDFPLGFNPLECHTPEAKHQVVTGFIAIFKKLFAHNWTNRLEHMLRFTVLALVEIDNTTVLDIVRLLTDVEFRQSVIAKLEDPVVKNFWTQEFASWNEKFDNEAIIPIINQVGQFIANDYIRYVVGQPHSAFDFAQVMQEGKILIINLAKGKLGEENTALLGSMLITKIQEATMARVSLKEKDRQEFYLYVDEFQHFATDSFNQILSEARKFNLSVTIAHQYLDQLTDGIRKTVFGNIGSFVSFRVGPDDARFLAREFTPTTTQNDFINLDVQNIYAKISVKGKTTEPFSARTLTVPDSQKDYSETIIANSRANYATPREKLVKIWQKRESALHLISNSLPPPSTKKFEEPLI